MAKLPTCKMTCLAPTVFDIENSKSWLEHLNDYGFVVLHEAISEEHAQLSMDMFKQEWCTVSPKFDWSNTDTWTTHNSPMIWNKSSVMFNGFGQSDSNWHIRIHSRTKEAFTHVYNTPELSSSFDGFSLFLSDTQQSSKWLHQDQRTTDTRPSYQAILNILPCTELDAGFICVPKSHINYVQPPRNTDWGILPDHEQTTQKSCKILTPPRSLIIFNSKLIHANTGMVKKHPSKLHINRFSAYTTFVPKDRQPDNILQQRIIGYHQGVACSHWADRFEVKKLPFHVRKPYLAREFNTLTPTIIHDKIPQERLELF